jgi:hypothetical protein
MEYITSDPPQQQLVYTLDNSLTAPSIAGGVSLPLQLPPPQNFQSVPAWLGRRRQGPIV